MDDIALDLVVACEDLLTEFQAEFCRQGAFHCNHTIEGLCLVAEVLLIYCVSLEPLFVHLPVCRRLLNTNLNAVQGIANDLEVLSQRRQDHQRTRGRPRLTITEGQLVQLLGARFKIY